MVDTMMIMKRLLKISLPIIIASILTLSTKQTHAQTTQKQINIPGGYTIAYGKVETENIPQDGLQILIGEFQNITLCTTLHNNSTNSIKLVVKPEIVFEKNPIAFSPGITKTICQQFGKQEIVKIKISKPEPGQGLVSWQVNALPLSGEVPEDSNDSE
ncbi:MAG: hypothetical protein MRJ65_03090 [Candidatus Brocadiaceae bacterium]|nr:hypothetical protein [Candidatus Brocadiaceae bacterium]